MNESSSPRNSGKERYLSLGIFAPRLLRGTTRHELSNTLLAYLPPAALVLATLQVAPENGIQSGVISKTKSSSRRDQRDFIGFHESDRPFKPKPDDKDSADTGGVLAEIARRPAVVTGFAGH